MNEITRCTRCILPSTLKGITFNENGICNHCISYENNFSNWDQIAARKQKEFENILQKARSLKRPYDCLVPLSGGKDSTYALYLASRAYGLKTLAISFDNGYLTNPAKENVANALKHCSADHIYYTLNRQNSAELFKVFVEQTGDFCNSCMRGINYSIEFALRSFRIPLVIKGSGRRVQYVSQIKETSTLNTASYFRNVIRKTSAEKKFRYLAADKNRLEFEKIMGGIADVAGIKRSTIMRFFPQHIGMYDYIYKPYPEIIGILKREMGWSDHDGRAEHLDCELHDIPFFMNTLKIQNIGKNTFYYSGLIRQGLMTREEALRKDDADRNKEEVPEELQAFLSGNDLSYEDYISYVKGSDKSRFEPKLQKRARAIYHRMRKF